MDYIKYFKSQAKKFYNDFQTQYTIENDIIYGYNPEFWSDIDEIIVSFDIDEDDFSLMKAQHIIANLANFKNWNELIHSNEYLHCYIKERIKLPLGGMSPLEYRNKLEVAV